MRRPRTVEIIGHRGSSFLAPENTIASLKLGWQETTICELDVHLTSDGRLLVIHDDSTKRTTGLDFQIRNHTLRELRKLDAGSWKGVRWKGEKLPSLEEVIVIMPADKKMLIEIKAGVEIIPELARVIRASGKTKRLLVHSFGYSVCVAARRALPQVPVYWLIAFKKNPSTRAWSPSVDEAISHTVKAGLDGMGVNDTALLDAAAVQMIHAAGLKINVWTVDRVRRARVLIDLGVDGIITNRPGWLRDRLAKEP